MTFYVVDRQRFNDKEYAYGEQVDQNTGEFEKCEICGSAVSMRKWLPPLKVKLSKPSYGDFVFGTFYSFLVSERFRNEYMNSEISGIKEFEPVEVVRINRLRPTSPQPPKYFYVSIVRNKARVNEIQSKFVRDGEVKCDFCQMGGVIKSFDGVYIEPGTWSGEDVFLPIGLTGTILVSDRFYSFVKEYEFTNINFVPAEQYQAPWAK